MVIDLALKGLTGKRGLMYVPYHGKSRAFISNYRSWRLYNNEGRIAEVASSLLSHETIHLTLNKFSVLTSAKLDNLFGRSNYWEKYQHGLGDLAIVHGSYESANKCANNGGKKRKKVVRKKLAKTY